MLSYHHENYNLLILHVFKLFPAYNMLLKLSYTNIPPPLFQKAALDLGVLTEDEFHELVVPEKMIGPSD